MLKGDTGSGKSTLVDIICGLQKANSGEILIDNNDINLINRSWYNKISYIQQNPYIFNLSLANNISIKKNLKEEDYKKISKIVKEVGLSKFVESLEFGLDTQLLDKGLNISGGKNKKYQLLGPYTKIKKLLFLMKLCQI